MAVPRVLGRWMLVMALMLSIGAHWALLQSAAWVGMVVRYSREGSFAEALNKTFDGRHPCAVCKAIKQTRTEEKQRKQQQLKTESKLDLALPGSRGCSIFQSFGPRYRAGMASDHPGAKPRPNLTRRASGDDAHKGVVCRAPPSAAQRVRKESPRPAKV